jgi:hypothetical protein
MLVVVMVVIIFAIITIIVVVIIQVRIYGESSVNIEGMDVQNEIQINLRPGGFSKESRSIDRASGK